MGNEHADLAKDSRIGEMLFHRMYLSTRSIHPSIGSTKFILTCRIKLSNLSNCVNAAGAVVPFISRYNEHLPDILGYISAPVHRKAQDSIRDSPSLSPFQYCQVWRMMVYDSSGKLSCRYAGQAGYCCAASLSGILLRYTSIFHSHHLDANRGRGQAHDDLSRYDIAGS